jgi:hypothetical protein
MSSGLEMANSGEWLAAVGFLVRSADANWERQGGRTALPFLSVPRLSCNRLYD